MGLIAGSPPGSPGAGDWAAAALEASSTGKRPAAGGKDLRSPSGEVEGNGISIRNWADQQVDPAAGGAFLRAPAASSIAGSDPAKLLPRDLASWSSESCLRPLVESLGGGFVCYLLLMELSSLGNSTLSLYAEAISNMHRQVHRARPSMFLACGPQTKATGHLSILGLEHRLAGVMLRVRFTCKRVLHSRFITSLPCRNECHTYELSMSSTMASRSCRTT